ncbi:hypothetical protein FOCC_FOCC014924, partial [Frankliniella occidentalis]
MRTVSERDYSAQEACHILSGRKLHEGSRKFVVVDLPKKAWVELQQRPDGLAHPNHPDQEAEEEHVDDDLEGDDGVPDAAHDDRAEDGGEGPADHDGVETFTTFVQCYMRRPAAMANMSLRDVALRHGPPKGRDNRWSNNRRGAIVRVFPRLKLTVDEEKNEQYYRVQVLLHVPWRSEEEVKGFFPTWRAVYEANNLGAMAAEGDAHGAGRNIHQAAAEVRTQVFAEDAQFEEPEGEDGEREVIDEWLAAARMGPHGPIEEIEVGRRDVDINYDWHASAGDYGGLPALRNFIANSKAAHAGPHVNPEEANIVYTAEQQAVLDLLQAQINSVLHPELNTPVVKRVIVQGKAGCGKSTVISKMMAMITNAFGPEAVKLMAFTGVAALNIGGETINSALNRGAGKMPPEALRRFQDTMANVRFLIIDEYSMVGSRLLGYMERRCRDGKPDSDVIFGGCFVYLVGDIKQLPPVGDYTLYPKTNSRR